jgi:putative ABC transport system permease protein
VRRQARPRGDGADPLAAQLADAVYRALLVALPRGFRREFGDEMACLFRDQRDAARDRAESARLWTHAVRDLMVHGARERFGGRRIGFEGLHWRWPVSALANDFRYALRTMRRQPGVASIAVLTLALGIGLNSAVFSIIHAVLLRPLPYPEPDRLVMVWEKRPREGVYDNVVAPADYLDWARLNTVFERISPLTMLTVDLTGAGDPVRLEAAGVGVQFFDVLGVRMLAGRTFAPHEGVLGRHRVAVLDHAIWQARFGADRGLVGRTILLNGLPFEVIGILPPAFEFPSRADVWVPLILDAGPQPPSRGLHQLNVYARLRPGVTFEQSRAEMDRLGRQLEAQYPDTNRGHGPHVVRMKDELVQPVRAGLLVMLAAVSFVLLIACVNVANLLLARAASRRREMAVRTALGAGRARLAAQLLVESLTLAAAGGAAALGAAAVFLAGFRRFLPPDLTVFGFERVGLEPEVLAYTLAIAGVTGLVFGVFPAWQLSRQDPNEPLKEGGRSPAGVRRRLRAGLVIAEVALASLLLVAAGLMLRSFQALLDEEPGFETRDALVLTLPLPAARYRGQEQVRSLFTDLESRLAGTPGVRAAGAISHLPMSGMDSRLGIAIEGREPTPDAPTRAHPRSVTSGYFAALGIPVLRGRAFTPTDDERAPLVAIVNETMAARYWPGGSPIGARVRLGGEWREVVGIVRDVKHWGLDRAVNPEMYMPARQYRWNIMNFAIATTGDPSSVAAAVLEHVKAVDSALPLPELSTMADVMAQSMAVRRASMLLLGTFGLLALALAAIGIYGVMAHLVAARTMEIGVRVTLGASPADVMTLVLGEGLLQACLGLAIGFATALLLSGSLDALLYRIDPRDPITFASSGLVLLAAALLACTLPARRAMRVDPAAAIREA